MAMVEGRMQHRQRPDQKSVCVRYVILPWWRCKYKANEMLRMASEPWMAE